MANVDDLVALAIRSLPLIKLVLAVSAVSQADIVTPLASVKLALIYIEVVKANVEPLRLIPPEAIGGCVDALY